MKWSSLFSIIILTMPLTVIAQEVASLTSSYFEGAEKGKRFQEKQVDKDKVNGSQEISAAPMQSFGEDLLTKLEQDFYQYEYPFITELFHGREPHRFIAPYKAMAIMPHNISEFNHASGNWLGYRDELHSHGFEFSTTYTSDIAGNPVGGKIPGGFTYCDNFAFACLIETEKLFGWHGGYFMISGLQRDGDSLSRRNIGNQFDVQQVAGEHTFRWYELSYQQDFWDCCANLKTGRIAALDDFDVSPLYWLYMNNAIDGNIQALPVNGRMSVYPLSSWGSRLKINLTTHTALRLGVYQQMDPSINGLNWNFYPSNGVVMMGQYSWEPIFFSPINASVVSSATKERSEKKLTTTNKGMPSDQSFKAPADVSKLKGLPGHYLMGGYYSTWEYHQFNSTTSEPNAYGLYWHADQMLYRPNPINDAGLILWSAYSFCPQQNISLRPFQVNGGAIYTGLIPGRVNDNTIFGGAYGNFSSSFVEAQQAAGNGNRMYELMFELGYRINFTKFFYVQPDTQWIINPDGNGAIPNALVFGAQIGVIF